MAQKINAICNILIPQNKQLKWILGTLRQVRNDGEHRCKITQQEKDNDKLSQFFKQNTFNDIRNNLIEIITEIKTNISKPIELVEATICKIHPSSCFIEYYGKKEQIPNNLFKDVKDKQEGDKIKLSIADGKIIKIIEN